MEEKVDIGAGKQPPARSRSILSDIRYFLLHKPENNTFVRFKTFDDRLAFRYRIMQRIGMDASIYSVLNVHKIGIDAPVHHIFSELMSWNGDSTCWPNHIAEVRRIDDDIENIKILPFGWEKYPFGFKKSFLGLRFIPLFNLKAIKIKAVPDTGDSDNARYLLYECSGGYPIGFFALYVRSSIPEEGETEMSQLFCGVGFDFYGRKNWANRHVIVKLWTLIHNSVTRNVLNRFRQLCEWRMEKTMKGNKS